MYERIVMAMDGSETSRRGLDTAIRLAREGHARLLILHVVEEPLPLAINGDWALPALPLEAYRQAAARLLEDALAACREAGVAAETRLLDAAGRRIGPLVSETAAEWQADLIVAGTHGRRWLDRLLLGSVAEGILRTARTPVLLLPPA